MCDLENRTHEMDASVVVIIHTTSCIVQWNGLILANSANNNNDSGVSSPQLLGGSDGVCGAGGES